ncbi:hypothetical protein [Chelativorans sp.]|uniref:hypothetical protein n=1 Tax=Chelativorans sp. TaxID=2203393 RepID=UPI002810ED00|nr:hypothetical protein [Chelativorans sp.]
MPSKTVSERRAYWGSMAALGLVLPAAVLAHSWGSLAEWYDRHGREPILVEGGVSPIYAGAAWRLVYLKRLPGPSAKAAVVLAEFEARVGKDTASMAGMCRIRLTDADGRLWAPTFTLEPIARKAYPGIEERPLCGGPAFAEAGPGGKVDMVATFLVPHDAVDLALLIGLAEAEPDTLLLKP